MLKLINPIAFPPLVLILAYILDLVFGDPSKLPHPVVWIGRAITFVENRLRKHFKTPSGERLRGCILAIIIVAGVWTAAFAVLYVSYIVSFPLFFIISTYIVWTSLSIKSLKDEAKAVVKALKDGGIEAARERLSRIVGRDTGSLTEEGVMRAAVETVAENTGDGVVAPLFYLALGGPPLMIAYKAVNTLDSMVGYKNERYRDFGWFSARLDDAANYIPARISALLITAASFILGYNWVGSFKTFIRDGRKHPSPNSGFPEAAVAGALEVTLGGPSAYGGVVSEKPYIGDGKKSIDAETVKSSVRLMWLAGFLMVFFSFIVRVAVMFASR